MIVSLVQTFGGLHGAAKAVQAVDWRRGFLECKVICDNLLLEPFTNVLFPAAIASLAATQLRKSDYNKAINKD